MLHPLKITSTLADETRFQIYNFMLQHKRMFTVQEVADKFRIHPNVARLHLTKLTEIKVITADFVKTGKGGRPGRVYQATEEGISLTFPRREDPILLTILLLLLRYFLALRIPFSLSSDNNIFLSYKYISQNLLKS